MTLSLTNRIVLTVKLPSGHWPEILLGCGCRLGLWLCDMDRAAQAIPAIGHLFDSFVRTKQRKDNQTLAHQCTINFSTYRFSLKHSSNFHALGFHPSKFD